MRAGKLIGALLTVTMLVTLGASSASAAFGLKNIGLSFRNQDGSVATEAGSHPYEMAASIGVTTKVVPDLGEVPEEEVKDLRVDLPAGFVGDRAAVPYCSSEDFIARNEGRSGCPDGTALGVAALKLASEAIPAGSGDIFLHVPVYNLVPPPGAAAKLGFVALNVPITVNVGLSETAPYHLVATSTNIPQALLFYDSVLTTWGNPASPLHDPYRGQCLSVDPTELTEEPVSRGLCPVNLPEKPFLTMPRSCTGPPSTLFTITPWKLPRTPVSEAAVTEDDSTPPIPMNTTGCTELGFSPEIVTQPTTASAESPMGLDVSIDVKDEGLTSLTGRAASDIQKAVVTLPEGVTVNPSAAEGLGVCSPAQLDAESLAPFGGCPESSKLGNVAVKTPLLPGETLSGSLYQAQQDDPATTTPGTENPFDTLLALYVVIKDPQNGILVKLPGRVDPDPKTGQLISTFENLPQLPFSSFKLHFREGPRSPLVTPPLCGTYTTKAVLTPWANPSRPLTTTASFKVSSGPGGTSCPPGGAPPFSPGFEAGSVNNNAGSYSPFYMRLTRRDGEQDMTRFDSVLPPGVVGKIAGVAKCTDASIEAAKAKTGRQEQATPSCPSASRVGRVLVGAGVGPSLTYVPGTIYLAGPYGGAPLSVAVITPAVAGPFDAGTVVVREALNLNPNTAEVQVDGAASDPIPHILKGIPLKLRDLRVYVDRPEFTLNSTSCDPEQVKATVFGSFLDVFSPADDLGVALQDRYQAANCSRLAFKPKLKLKLKGSTKRSGNPALRSTLTARRGDANIGRAVVTLPPSENIDNAHINNPCTRVQFNENACPKSSILGHAKAFTPLLDEPLEGKVYFRSNGGERLLPDIVADLKGQFRVILVGFVDSKNARVRTTFANVPDAPVTKFQLNLFGGKRGLLENNRNLCKHKLRSKFRFTGQNNKVSEVKPVLATSCKKKVR